MVPARDTLSFSDDTTIVDAAFAGVSGFETIQSGGANAGALEDVTLGTNAAAAGITTVNFVDAGSAESVTIQAGFTNTLAVDLEDDAANNTLDASAYTGSLTVTADTRDLDNGGATAITLTGGTGTNILSIDSDHATALVANDLDAITNFDKFVVTGSVAADITLATENAGYTSATVYDHLTVDASALGAAATIDAAEETTAKITVLTGASGDTVTSSASTNFGDSINTAAGDDTIIFGNTDLTADDTVVGGAGADTIKFNEGVTILDAAFANVSGVETITSTAATVALTSVTLGSNAAAAGVNAVTLIDTNNAESITLAAGMGDVTITLDDDSANNTITASAYTGTLNITATNLTLDNGGSTAVTLTGGAGTENLNITTASTQSLVADDLDAIVDIDNWVVTGSHAINFTLANESASYTHASSYGSYTIDASALTTVTTIDATEEDDGKLTIITGSGDDVVTADVSANFGSNISTGAGADTIHIGTNATLTALDTINGGAGSDTISFTLDTSLGDAVFANVSNVEVLTTADNKEFDALTLGANALAAGVSTVTMTGDDVGVVTVGSGFTGNLTVNLTEDEADGTAYADKVDASGTTGAVQVAVAATSFQANDTVDGGTGTGDSITFTADDATATITKVTGVETINITGASSNDKTITIVMGANDTQIAAGKTLTVDASATTGLAATAETLTFTGTASETDGFLNITGGAGADTIVGAAAADTISGGGAAADSITGGLGADSLTGGDAGDTFVYSAVAQSSSGTALDTITDFTTGTDKLEVTLDYSGLGGSAATVNATLVTAAAGTTAVQNSLSGERGQYIYDTTNNKIIVNVNNDNLISTLDYQINSSTVNASGVGLADGDINFSITGGAGGDTITAGGGVDTISGGAGADSITGGSGTDSLVGGAGADTIAGGTGADTITGGTGDDSITGAGADTFVLAGTAAGGRDSITFIESDTDLLSLAANSANNIGGTASVAYVVWQSRQYC